MQYLFTLADIFQIFCIQIAEAMVGLSPEVNEYKQEVDFLQDPLSYLHSNGNLLLIFFLRIQPIWRNINDAHMM